MSGTIDDHVEQKAKAAVDAALASHAAWAAGVEATLGDLERRVGALATHTHPVPEPGTGDPPPPDPAPPPGGPWEQYRTGYGAAASVPSTFERVDTPEQLHEALADKAPGIEVPGGVEWDVGALRLTGPSVAIVAAGPGAVLHKTSGGPLININEGDHEVMLHGFHLRGTGNPAGGEFQDGLNVYKAGEVRLWVDACSFDSFGDEQTDIWGRASEAGNPPPRRATFSRCAYYRGGWSNGHEMGPLVGSEPVNGVRTRQDARVTWVRSYFETFLRNPWLAGPGAVGHLLDCVWGYWGNAGMQATEGAVVVSDRGIYNAEHVYAEAHNLTHLRRAWAKWHSAPATVLARDAGLLPHRWQGMPSGETSLEVPLPPELQEEPGPVLGALTREELRERQRAITLAAGAEIGRRFRRYAA